MNSKPLSVTQVVVMSALAAILLLLAGYIAVSQSDASADRVDISPTEMSERANELLRSFGYRERPAERWSEFRFEQTLEGKRVVRFVERQSLDHFSTVIDGTTIVPQSALGPGERRVVLDSKGRMVEFAVRFPKTYDSSEPANKFDWNAAFTAAGLDLAAFTPIDAAWTPTAAADDYAAWTGKLPESPTADVRIEASTFRGQLTNFQIVFPWIDPDQSRPAAATTKDRLLIALTLVAIVVFLFAAVRRIWSKSVESDGSSQPALLLALATFVTVFIGQLSSTPQVPAFGPILERSMFALIIALATAAIVWAVYLATANGVLRNRPELLSSLQSLATENRFAKIIGNDAIVGVLAGAVISLILALSAATGGGLRLHNVGIGTVILSPFGATILGIGLSMLVATLAFGVFAILHELFRSRLVAGIGLFLLMSGVIWYVYGASGFELALLATIFAVIGTVLARYGLLATVVAIVVTNAASSALAAYGVSSVSSLVAVISSAVIVLLMIAAIVLSFMGTSGSLPERDERSAV